MVEYEEESAMPSTIIQKSSYDTRVLSVWLLTADESVHLHQFHELVEPICIAIEAIVKVAWCSAISKTRIVGRQQPPAIGQPQHQVPELERGARIAMRQQDCRRIGPARLAIEGVDIADLDAAMVNLPVHRFILRLRSCS